MSSQSLEKIHQAIAEHLRDVDDSGILTDWFIGYATLRTEDGIEDYVTHISYTTSASSSPHATYGLATLATRSMRDDIEGR